jgi:hypothetical protein
MTITIPVWLLWTVGIVIGLPVAFLLTMCAYIGFRIVWDYVIKG